MSDYFYSFYTKALYIGCDVMFHCTALKPKVTAYKIHNLFIYPVGEILQRNKRQNSFFSFQI